MGATAKKKKGYRKDIFCLTTANDPAKPRDNFVEVCTLLLLVVPRGVTVAVIPLLSSLTARHATTFPTL